ncbi:MAG: glutamate 5-kinase, partial [Gammaproteobacteria bacterium]
MYNLNSYNRIVVKIGSAVIVNPRGKIDHMFLANLAEDIASLRKKNKEVLIVSSGAIALGRKNISLPNNLSLAESQALAAHGQIELMIAWKKHLNKHDIHVGQILLTPRETELKISANNAKQTLAKLLDVGCLPIINENDSTATDEIRFGDNDLLAAKISNLFKADLLIVLSSVDGLYA